MGLVDQLKAYAALGRGELRGIYRERKKEIEAKAELKRHQAKTRIGAAKAKADKAREMADLEAAMYQAEIDQQLAEERAKQLRHRAGHYTVGERFGRQGLRDGMGDREREGPADRVAQRWRVESADLVEVACCAK